MKLTKELVREALAEEEESVRLMYRLSDPDLLMDDRIRHRPRDCQVPMPTRDQALIAAAAFRKRIPLVRAKVEALRLVLALMEAGDEK